MLALAVNYGQNPILLKDIARKEDISEGYLQHIVDTLKGAGLVYSNRVGHGGYTLARPPSEINLRDILNTLEGSINLVECVEKPDVCDRSGGCVTRDIWAEVGSKLEKTLRAFTLQDMVERRNMKTERYPSYEI
jgi:Rrf2 family protein